MNLSDTELIRYRTYQLQKLIYTDLIGGHRELGEGERTGVDMSGPQFHHRACWEEFVVIVGWGGGPGWSPILPQDMLGGVGGHCELGSVGKGTRADLFRSRC
jgi:hypothetical protein